MEFSFLMTNSRQLSRKEQIVKIVLPILLRCFIYTCNSLDFTPYIFVLLPRVLFCLYSIIYSIFNPLSIEPYKIYLIFPCPAKIRQDLLKYCYQTQNSLPRIPQNRQSLPCPYHRTGQKQACQNQSCTGLYYSICFLSSFVWLESVHFLSCSIAIPSRIVQPIESKLLSR